MDDIPGYNKWSEVKFELYFKAQKEESVCIFLRGSDTCLLFGLGLTLRGSLIDQCLKINGTMSKGHRDWLAGAPIGQTGEYMSIKQNDNDGLQHT